VWREKFLVRPAGNQTGDLLLMRQVWYDCQRTFAKISKN
jgi:hypothetical protein